MVSRGEESVGFDEQTASDGVVLMLGFHRYAKRAFDIAMAVSGIVLFSPILLITSLAIKLESAGPILVRETLFGYGKRIVRVHRFRFVAHGAETQAVTPRLTRVGRTLQQTGIGELPELFSVLAGDMSIVGPRPFVSQLDLSECPDTPLLNSIKPGMVDWAGPAEFRTVEQRINDDLFHAVNRSPYLDIITILAALFSEKSAKHPSRQKELDTSFARRKVASAK
jgi:lipopolysaccharide/colanic/teichoic acid biosynthesis glycosyltransferase